MIILKRIRGHTCGTLFLYRFFTQIKSGTYSQKENIIKCNSIPIDVAVHIETIGIGFQV